MNSDVQKRFLGFSKNFIDAAKNIFETMIFTKLEPEKPVIKNDYKCRGNVSAILGLNGTLELDGSKVPYRSMLVISFPYETYLKTASAMLMEEYTEYSEDIADVGGEICNMIMGNTKRKLSEMGYSCNMAIPSIIEGQNHTIQYPSNTTVVLIPVKSAHGPFFIELCYSEGGEAID
jgi:chemotaxis protein CheX